MRRLDAAPPVVQLADPFDKVVSEETPLPSFHGEESLNLNLALDKAFAGLSDDDAFTPSLPSVQPEPVAVLPELKSTPAFSSFFAEERDAKTQRSANLASELPRPPAGPVSLNSEFEQIFDADSASGFFGDSAFNSTPPAH